MTSELDFPWHSSGDRCRETGASAGVAPAASAPQSHAGAQVVFADAALPWATAAARSEPRRWAGGSTPLALAQASRSLGV